MADTDAENTPLTPDYFQKQKPLLVLMKGGTIDAQSYLQADIYKNFGIPPEFVTTLKHSIVPKALKAMPQGEYCSFLQLKMDDSQKIVKDKEDMEATAELIRRVDQPLIVMSLGTDGMAEMARAMDEKLKGSGKVLVITGAMDPLTHGRKKSDGYGNLDFATKAALSGQLEPGVYVAMQDREGTRRVYKADDSLEKIKEYVPVFDKDGDASHRYFASFVGNHVDIDLSKSSPYMQRQL